jgi:hypothetical protein
MLQEVKLPQPKLTKELVVVPGYQVGPPSAMQLMVTVDFETSCICFECSIPTMAQLSYTLEIS